ncbi:hypothetical protein ACFYT4_35305 [Streptomyces sp. NPDC004609]|uniref:hypothetical protein n=1 Tax=Streptomyces sp. NPDC004609 TaxID=3364704 RepID=UPI00369121E5
MPAPRPAAVVPALEPEPADIDDEELVLEELTREQVRDWRVRGMKDHQVVFDHIDRYGRTVREAPVQPPAGRPGAAPFGHPSSGPRAPRLGAGVRGGEVSGVVLARVALRAAMEAACRNGGGRKGKQKPRPVRTVRRDGREPMGLGAALSELVTE